MLANLCCSSGLCLGLACDVAYPCSSWVCECIVCFFVHVEVALAPTWHMNEPCLAYGVLGACPLPDIDFAWVLHVIFATHAMLDLASACFSLPHLASAACFGHSVLRCRPNLRVWYAACWYISYLDWQCLPSSMLRSQSPRWRTPHSTSSAHSASSGIGSTSNSSSSYSSTTCRG